MQQPEEDKPKSIEEFGARLDKLRPKLNSAEEELRARERGDLGRGLRLASEMLAAFLVTGALGYSTDKLFGTMPIFLLIGLAIGFAAGLLNVKRAIDEMDADLAEQQDTK